VRDYYVYIMSSTSRRLYTGITNNVERRLYEHKHHLLKGFTDRYNIELLVYYEHFNEARAAIAREKQIKGWLRRKKIALIEAANPKWHDLSENWFTK
jgi:putative endonuclease